MESKRAKSRPTPQTCGFRLPTLLRGHPLKTPERSACKKILHPEQKKQRIFTAKKNAAGRKDSVPAADSLSIQQTDCFIYYSLTFANIEGSETRAFTT